MQMLCKSCLMSEEFEVPHGHFILKKDLLHVNYVLKVFYYKQLEDTHESSRWVKALFLEKMLMLCKSFLMSEEFEGPCGQYLLEKGFLHVNYVLKRFLVETT